LPGRKNICDDDIPLFREKYVGGETKDHEKLVETIKKKRNTKMKVYN